MTDSSEKVTLTSKELVDKVLAAAKREIAGKRFVTGSPLHLLEMFIKIVEERPALETRAPLTLAAQIEDARRRIAAWPDDVRIAMGLPSAQKAGSLLRAPSTHAPPGCHCTERCMAPVVMGRQQPCRDPDKAARLSQKANVVVVGPTCGKDTPDGPCRSDIGHEGDCDGLPY